MSQFRQRTHIHSTFFSTTNPHKSWLTILDFQLSFVGFSLSSGGFTVWFSQNFPQISLNWPLKKMNCVRTAICSTIGWIDSLNKAKTNVFAKNWTTEPENYSPRHIRLRHKALKLDQKLVPPFWQYATLKWFHGIYKD